MSAVLTLALLAAPDLTPTQIDRMVRAEWRKHDVTPAPRASDAAFLRRVWLDLAGTLPPVDDIKKFLADPARDKRARAVDALLASPRYADHFTDYWDNVLLGRRPPPVASLLTAAVGATWGGTSSASMRSTKVPSRA